MNKRLGVGLALFAFGFAQAQNNYTNSYHEVAHLAFYSKNDTIVPSWAGFVQVLFAQTVTWAIPNVCNGTAVAIRDVDTHMIAAVQTALASERPVRLFVEDTQRLDGTFCILRAIQY